MRLNEILNIRYPFIQGGMANIATGEFAAAVSNAGGLGLIGAGGMNAEQFRENIRKCKTLTEKPFGVNLMLMNPQDAGNRCIGFDCFVRYSARARVWHNWCRTTTARPTTTCSQCQD